MKKAIKMITLFLVISLIPTSILAQSIEGIWKTVDDKTGKVNSTIELKKIDGKLYGTIKTIVKKEGDPENPVCDKCPDSDPRKGKPVKGMQILQGATLDDGEWVGEKAILDPENGKVYNCKIWLNDEDSNKLNVRGYIGFFYRTQTWIR